MAEPAMMPATWVPCPYASSTDGSFVTKLMLATILFFSAACRRCRNRSRPRRCPVRSRPAMPPSPRDGPGLPARVRSAAIVWFETDMPTPDRVIRGQVSDAGVAGQFGEFAAVRADDRASGEPLDDRQVMLVRDARDRVPRARHDDVHTAGRVLGFVTQQVVREMRAVLGLAVHSDPWLAASTTRAELRILRTMFSYRHHWNEIGL